MILTILFMVYVCVVEKNVIYTYIICLIAIAVLILIDILYLKKNLADNYTVSILILSLIMIVFSGAEVFYYSIALSLIFIATTLYAYRIINKDKNKSVINTKDSRLDIPIGFFLVVSNILLIIISNFIKA